MIQTIIIGKGPAGISAAIYLKRAGIDPLVIGKDLGALDGYQSTIENYYGFIEPINGESLIQSGINQAKRLGIEIIDDTIVSIKDQITSFTITTRENSYETKTILLATGKNRQNLSIPGYKKFQGKGISMCATCDGYFYRRKKIAIVGCGFYMKHELEYLSRMTPDITIFTHGNPLTEKLPYAINREKIKAFTGDFRIRAIETESGVYPIDGVFIALGAPSSLEFASQLGLIIEKNSLVVDHNYQTNVTGVFAAGDVIGGKLQIAKAVFDGMEAADSIYQYLKKSSD